MWPCVAVAGKPFAQRESIELMTANQLHRLDQVQVIDRPLDEVFEIFSNAANLEALTPTFLSFRILTPLPIAMFAGARIEYALGLFGLPMRWRTLISDWEPPEVDPADGVSKARFVDQQVSGPYAVWKHTHEFEAVGNQTRMRDVVDYAVPFGFLGDIAHVLFVRRTLDRIFAHRRVATAHMLDGGPAPRQLSIFEVGLQIAGEVIGDFWRGLLRAGRDASEAVQGAVAPKAASEPSISPFDIEVFFDGDCPLCIREINMLRKLDKGNRVRFTDIASPSFDTGDTGLTWTEFMERIHGRLPDGTMIEGVEVFRHLYSAVGFGRLVSLTRLPVVREALHVGYLLFAKNRLRMTGRCMEDICAVAPNSARIAGVGL